VGQIVQVTIPADRETGRPRGFAFVEFSDGAAAADAIEKFNGYEFKGRGLGVKEAIERQPRPRIFSDAKPFGMPSGRSGSKPKGSRRNLRSKKRSL